MTKADEMIIRRIIQEELTDFFAKTVGIIPIENKKSRKSGAKTIKNVKINKTL
ncbi:MAG: hypothetical protein WBM13_11235 [Bacteroidia bacterium]